MDDMTDMAEAFYIREESFSRKEVLEAATQCVCVDRKDQYGETESNFSLIAQLWSCYLGVAIEPKDVASMMILLKLARVKTGTQKKDNWVDIAGYAACGGEVEF